MKDHSAMAEFSDHAVPLSAARRSRAYGVRERVLLPLVLCVLVRSGQALAGDHSSAAGTDLKPDSVDPKQQSVRALPLRLEAPHDSEALDVPAYSSTEFTPRKRSALTPDLDHGGAFGLEKSAPDVSIWQRMAESQSLDRVRLLTLWEARGSTLSVDTGKHGHPSLQWSTPLAGRVSGSQGLFDHLFSSTPRSSVGPRNAASRALAGPVTLKQLTAPPGPGNQ
jgi:hypothetical protein